MNPVQDNPLKTRDQVAQAALSLLRPLLERLSDGKARLSLGETGAVYPPDVAEMEAYSRPLWALVPMMAGGFAEAAPFFEAWQQGLIHGTDPAHPEYWGEIEDIDQRMVEMAVMGMGLCFARTWFFDTLSPAARKNVHAWLSQINHHAMPENNWRFFRVLVNIGFQLTGQAYDQERLAQDLSLIEDHYEGDGWYYDTPDQRDYYTAWGFHYYGLLYAVAMGDRDPERALRFRERARLFAPSFAAWFAADGEALPYGRSLGYRFAQAGFFAAMAFAGETTQALPWGAVKGLVLRNLRKWLGRPIFDPRGILTIGYGYPNLHMAEGYNASGSAYWGMKAFAMLALPEAHPFWQAAEQPYTPPRRCLQRGARMLILRDRENLHVQAFPAGNHAQGHSHDDAKYEKFAYSTCFAFSVPKGVRMLHRGAFDSMLAVSLDGVTWLPRYGVEDYRVGEREIRCTWRPFPQVRIETRIVPLGEWHLREHRIQTPLPLHLAEGGYAIATERGRQCAEALLEGMGALVEAPWGASGIRSLGGWREAQILRPEPNTNLLYPRTLLPTLLGSIPPGEHLLRAAILGAAAANRTAWASPPREEDLG